MKGALRAPLRAARRARGPAERSRLAQLIAARAAQIPALASADCVAVYASLPAEPGTHPLREALRARGAKVLLPVVPPPGQHTLLWAVDDGGELVAGAGLGMPEPTGELLGPEALGQAQVVLVPALAADRSGNRLGKGRGYYDAALRHAAPDALLLAVLFDDEILDAIPAEPHDVRVHGVLTPSRMMLF